MSYAAKIIADSISPDGVRLTTIEVTFPRIVLAEFNTHRMFSRNAASSRAIPVSKMLERVTTDPFLPVWWGKNQAGMQAQEELTGEALAAAKFYWLDARDYLIATVKNMQGVDLHKQIANRLLESFMWVTDVVTATEWSNFFALRCHRDAQPEIRIAAEMMRDALAASTPKKLGVGRWQWHLPYVTDEDILHAEHLFAPWTEEEDNFLKKISTARCAATSYARQGEQRDYDKDIQLHDRLVAPGHWSPFEHVARPIMREEKDRMAKGLLVDADGNYWCGNFRGWWQYRKDFVGENR